MSLNILIGGAAGQGVETTAAIFERLLKQAGYFLFSSRDFMSRIRGGHNFALIRFGDSPIDAHTERLDGLVALNDETVPLHLDALGQDGFILCDCSEAGDDQRMQKVDLRQIAKGLGNPRVAGSVAIGALLGLFGLGQEQVRAAVSAYLAESLVDINVQAIDAGFHSVTPIHRPISGSFSDWMLLTGAQAIGLGAMAAGVKFYSAYPMSPSTGILEHMARYADRKTTVVEQAEDEIAAINMAIGAAFTGVRAMTASSGGGFSLMVEALGLAGIAEIPVVIVDAQRPGPATGLPTRTEQADLRFVISAAQGEFPRIVIALRNHRDAFWQTLRAFDLADRYQVPVILLADQYLADTTTTVKPFSLDQIKSYADPLPAGTADVPYRRYALTESGVSPRLFPGDPKHLVMADSDEHDQDGCITESAYERRLQTDKRLRKLDGIRREMQEPYLLGPEQADMLLLGWGSMHGPLSEAVALLNRDNPGSCNALVFGDIWPLPTARLESMARQAKSIVNVEQNATGQLAGLIREITGIRCGQSILKYDGRQLSGTEIAKRVAESVKEARHGQ